MTEFGPKLDTAQHSDEKTKNPDKKPQINPPKLCFYLGLSDTHDFFLVVAVVFPSKRFYPSRTEDHVHFSGFLEILQQL